MKGDDLDSAAKEIPDFVPGVLQQTLARQTTEYSVDRLAGATSMDIVLLGWSKAAGHIVARHFRSDDKECRLTERKHESLLPAVPGVELGAKPFDRAAMLRAMRAQYRWAKESGHEGGGFGGHMVYVDIRKDAISIDSSSAI